MLMKEKIFYFLFFFNSFFFLHPFDLILKLFIICYLLPPLFNPLIITVSQLKKKENKIKSLGDPILCVDQPVVPLCSAKVFDFFFFFFFENQNKPRLKTSVYKVLIFF